MLRSQRKRQNLQPTSHENPSASQADSPIFLGEDNVDDDSDSNSDSNGNGCQQSTGNTAAPAAYTSFPGNGQCAKFTVSTGLRGCACNCSKITRHQFTCMVGGTEHAEETFSSCNFARINVLFEITGFLHLLTLATLLLLSSVFRELHDLHPWLHHLPDVIVLYAVQHARFHDSARVVDGVLVCIASSLCVKAMFIVVPLLRVLGNGGGGCETFRPCAGNEIVFFGVLALSATLLLLSVYLAVLLVGYRRLLVVARKNAKHWFSR